MENNPLSKYFREPGIHIDLPSKLRWYSDDFIETSVNHEVAIYPMTGKDELLLKNPDSLLNGSAIEEVIKSCVPGIKNPRNLIAPDADALMLAIRVCSYGDHMDVSSKCPNCGFDNEYSINVRNALENMEYLEDEYEIELNSSLKAVLSPYEYGDMVKSTLAAHREAKLLNDLEREEYTEEQKKELFNDTFNSLSKLKFELLSKSIIKIITPDDEVKDKKFISEFINNIDKDMFKILETKIEKINSTGPNKTMNFVCQSCSHNWETEVIFDPANFFG